MLGYADALRAPEQKPQDIDFAALGTHRTRIDGAHNRGIMLSQLLRVKEFIQCHELPKGGWLPWTDLAPSAYSRTSGQRLNVATINLYQACTPSTLRPRYVQAYHTTDHRRGSQVRDWVIEPATRVRAFAWSLLPCGDKSCTPRWKDALSSS